MIDTHLHVLPGIDDGARSFEDSVNILRWLERQGVTDVIATPHYMDETNFVSPREENLKLIKELEKRLEAEGVNVNVYLGNEVYIDKKILSLLEEGKISTLADSKYLLVELPLDGEYPNYKDILWELLDHGYQVVLAHPERYEIVQKNFEVLKKISEMGVLLQCNLGSVLGRYGDEPKAVIQKIAKEKMAFMFASDTHRVGRMEHVALARKKLLKYYNEREISQLLIVNPRKILMDL